MIIDGGSPEFYSNFKFPPLATAIIYFIKFATVTGLIRILGNISSLLSIDNKLKVFPKDMRKIANIMFYTKLFNKNSLEELSELNNSAKTVLAKGPIGNVPLVILTAEKSNLDKKTAENWFETQTRFREWSSNSKQYVVVHTTHGLPLERPDVIVKEVLELINIEDISTCSAVTVYNKNWYKHILFLDYLCSVVIAVWYFDCL